MNYRLYQPGDFTQLYAIEEACFAPPLRFPRSYMRQIVSSPHSAAWVAEEQGTMAGFAVVEWYRGSNGSAAYIETIEVAAPWRKQGIGAELLRRSEQSAQDAGAQTIWLHVDTENPSAIRLYEAHGYTYQGREEDYYSGQRPAFVYAKRLLHAK